MNQYLYNVTNLPAPRRDHDLQVVVPRTAPVVTLAEMKLHLRVEDDVTEDDDLIEGMVEAASDYAEMYARRTIITTQYLMTFDDFPAAQWFHLPRSPLISLDSIQYYDTDGVLQTLAASTPARIAEAPEESWPETQTDRIEAVQVTFTAGEAEARKTMKVAVKLLAAHWYENREAVTGVTLKDVPKTVDMLLDGERVYEVS